MATTYWNPNAANVAQVDTLRVTIAPVGGTLSATINGKSVTYTCISGDTTSTAASGWQALLSSSDAPPVFQEITWTVSTTDITGTANTPGTPYTLSISVAGGAGATLTHTTANSSESDVNNASNWMRSGSASLPQNGDDVIVADSDIALLWNLNALAAVEFNSFNRYQSFTGTIGLPDVNAGGYIEYRPTYFRFVGAGGQTLNVVLGIGDGSGPTRERYNVGSQLTALTVVASGTAADEYAVRFLGTNASNTARILNATVGVAFWPGEVSTLASATIDGGGTLALGPGTTFSGTLTVTGGGSATVFCNLGALVVTNGSTVTVIAQGTQVSGVVTVYASVTATGGSKVTWLSNGTITSLTLGSGSQFDKSLDARSMIVTNATVDGDSCQVLDPLSTITWTNPVTVNNAVTSGPFTFQGSRTVRIV